MMTSGLASEMVLETASETESTRTCAPCDCRHIPLCTRTRVRKRTDNQHCRVPWSKCPLSPCRSRVHHRRMGASLALVSAHSWDWASDVASGKRLEAAWGQAWALE